MKNRSRAVFRLALFALCGVLLAACGRAGLHRQNDFARTRDAVVSFALRSPAAEDLIDFNYGTGFFVSERLVVTASHVEKQVRKAKDKHGGEAAEIVVFKKTLSGDHRFTVAAELVASDETNDLALFRVDSNEIKNQWESFQIRPLPLAEALPEIGEEIVLTGFFNNYPQPFTSIGTVSMITEEDLTIGKDYFDQAVFCDLTTLPGHSGGPVFSLQSGKVIGINTAVVNPGKDARRTAVAVNAGHIRELLRKAESNGAL